MDLKIYLRVIKFAKYEDLRPAAFGVHTLYCPINQAMNAQLLITAETALAPP